MRKRAIPVKGLFNGRDCFYLDPPKLIVGLVFLFALVLISACLCQVLGVVCGLGFLLFFLKDFAYQSCSAIFRVWAMGFTSWTRTMATPAWAQRHAILGHLAANGPAASAMLLFF